MRTCIIGNCMVFCFQLWVSTDLKKMITFVDRQNLTHNQNFCTHLCFLGQNRVSDSKWCAENLATYFRYAINFYYETIIDWMQTTFHNKLNLKNAQCRMSHVSVDKKVKDDWPFWVFQNNYDYVCQSNGKFLIGFRFHESCLIVSHA